MARSPSLATLDGIWKRILKIADGATMMTETTLEKKIESADANIIGNDPLAKVAQKDLEEVGGFQYTPEELHFAQDLQKSLPPEVAGKLEPTASVVPLHPFDPNAPS